MLESFSFFNLLVPPDPWISNLTLELATQDAAKVGNYTATIEVKLVDFAQTAALLMKVELTVLPVPKNNIPYF